MVLSIRGSSSNVQAIWFTYSHRVFSGDHLEDGKEKRKAIVIDDSGGKTGPTTISKESVLTFFS